MEDLAKRFETATKAILEGRLSSYRIPPPILERVKADAHGTIDKNDPDFRSSVLAIGHVASAEREASIVPGIDEHTPRRPIDTVAIIGAGTMGTGIAISLADSGINVTLIDHDRAGLDRGLSRIRGHYESGVSRGRLDAATAETRQSRIQSTMSIDTIGDVDVVIEAVFEDLELKQSIFRQLDKVARPGAVLATNTSGLNIEAIAMVTNRPQDVIGAHFFSPANVQRLLEIVRTDVTGSDIVATMIELGRRMGKVSLLARVYDGFIGNALFRQYIREGHFMLEEGALPHQIDRALTRFGFAMGLFGVHDVAGNDVGYQTRKQQQKTRPQDRRYSDLILSLCEMGRLGQKSGKGWYKYESGSRKPVPDPEVNAFIIAQSRELGIERREISDDEIIKRMLYAMVNEGARLLEKGIALRSSDIDLVWVTGYGFPVWRGGPMYYADTVGLRTVLADIEDLRRQHGVWWEVSPLLKALAEAGKWFSDFDAGGFPRDPDGIRQ